LSSISIKEARSILQKTITWTKKSSKGRQEWHKTRLDVGVPPQKLKTHVKTRFASKIILFQETLEFKHVIALCYGRQQSFALQAYVPSPQVWAIAQVVVDTLKLVV
jgi:DNA-binding PucR family transcriptional regulator